MNADETDEGEKTSIAKYVFSGAGLLATVFIFIYLMWYTKKMMRELEQKTRATISDLQSIEIQKIDSNHHEVEEDKTPENDEVELGHFDCETKKEVED